MTYPATLSRILQDGARFVHPDPWKNTLIQTRALGDVTITSGKVVVICPYMEPDWPSYTTMFPIGRFPVIESMQCRRQRSGDWPPDFDPDTQPYTIYQSLGAMIRFRDVEPVRWQLAAFPQDTPEKLEAIDLQYDFYGGYLNTKGYSRCFMDAEVGKILTERINRDAEYVMELLDTIEDDDEQNVMIDDVRGYNLVAFGQGGLGVSPAFIGYAADGTIACLVVDVGFEARKMLAEGQWLPPEAASDART